MKTGGEYGLFFAADDGQRVRRDGELVLDNWVMQSPRPCGRRGRTSRRASAGRWCRL
ncbi:MAG: hypothetical protein FJ224_12430 [Lentisphaerae bacterium]|nr:hypothetical protein [Lentisphaerota bacterium]